MPWPNEILVDEYRILVFPDLVGRGTRLFTAETTPSRLRRVSAETIGPAVLVRYEREVRDGKNGDGVGAVLIAGDGPEVAQHMKL